MTAERPMEALSTAPCNPSVRSEWIHSDRIKRESRHIYNKLHSISNDSTFIRHIHSLFPSLLLTANLRCGAWYTDPSITSAVSYFKSTDGHTHQWSFSLKRSNLHLVPCIVNAGGALIADSTRRGKSMPDALSKTIPIWCAVLNMASHKRYGSPAVGAPGFALETPKWMIPPTEHDQIRARIDGFVTSLLDSDLQMPKLTKALKPVFVTPQTNLTSLPLSVTDSSETEFTPVVLVSASKFVSDSASLSAHVAENAERKEESVYVQGAGDDHENWARGLTPDVFWKHQSELLACEKNRLETLVDRIVAEESLMGGKGGHWFTPLMLQDSDSAEDWNGGGGDLEVGETGTFVGSRAADHAFSAEEKGRYDAIVHFTSLPLIDSTDLPERMAGLSIPPDHSEPKAIVYPIHMTPNKKGLSAIRTAFPPAINLIHQTLINPSSSTRERRKVLVCCQDGKDLSSSLVVAILASCFTDQRELIKNDQEVKQHREKVTKDTTKRRLQWLVSANPRAAPSRAFLLRVNELLISPRHRPHANATPP